MLQTDVDGQTIEIRDVPIQQDDCDLRPGLGVNNGSPAIAFYWLSHVLLSYDLWTNRGQCNAVRASASISI